MLGCIDKLFYQMQRWYSGHVFLKKVSVTHSGVCFQVKWQDIGYLL